MDEALLAFLGSLVEIKTELGPNVYDAALERARVAIAAEVLVEAERRAIRKKDRHVRDGNVVTLRAHLPGPRCPEDEGGFP